jgi:hypothetical protein
MSDWSREDLHITVRLPTGCDKCIVYFFSAGRTYASFQGKDNYFSAGRTYASFQGRKRRRRRRRKRSLRGAGGGCHAG